MPIPSPADLLKTVPVVPVLTIEPWMDVLALGKALADGGLGVLEITLRTKGALDAIVQLRKALPQCVIGAGTILLPSLADEAAKAGAQFLVTPGTTPKLLQALVDTGLPALPGAATVSEMMTLAEAGFQVLKFFPAEAAGGTAFLRAAMAPLPTLRFCPTGGIDANRAREYLGLPNVLCVGGSWVAPNSVLKERDWASVTLLAKAAALLRRPAA